MRSEISAQIVQQKMCWGVCVGGVWIGTDTERGNEKAC